MCAWSKERVWAYRENDLCRITFERDRSIEAFRAHDLFAHDVLSQLGQRLLQDVLTNTNGSAFISAHEFEFYLVHFGLPVF